MKKNKIKLTKQDTLTLEHLLINNLPQHIWEIRLAESFLDVTVKQIDDSSGKNLKHVAVRVESARERLQLALEEVRCLMVGIGATLATEYEHEGLFDIERPTKKGGAK